MSPHNYLPLVRMVIRLVEAGMLVNKAVLRVSDAYGVAVESLEEWYTKYLTTGKGDGHVTSSK